MSISVSDLTLNQIKQIKPFELQKQYILEWRNVYFSLVCPLYSKVKNKDFNFSVPLESLTCRIMINELKDELLKERFSIEDLRESLISKTI